MKNSFFFAKSIGKFSFPAKLASATVKDEENKKDEVKASIMAYRLKNDMQHTDINKYNKIQLKHNIFISIIYVYFSTVQGK